MSKEHRRKQWIIGSILITFVSLLLLLLSYILFKNDLLTSEDPKSRVRKIELDLPGKNINKQDVWMSKIESQSKIQDKKIELLGDAVKKQIETRKETQKDTRDIESLKKDIDDLKQFVHEVHAPVQKNDAAGLTMSDRQINTASPGIKKYVLQLTNCGGRVGTILDTIPAGGFSKAVLLSSVDASVGISVSGDPQPVALRVLDQGNLPNNFRSRIKRCVLIASARGDLSSERVYMRLEKLSCIDHQGKVIETDVSGYVSGEDGKAGLKGKVVDRSGSMVSSAVLSGFLNGMSQFLQTSLTHMATHDPSKINSNNTNTTLLSPDLFKSGGLQGTTNAFDKLAEYYIKRAEQLQPVVQIASGRCVDIVFTKSVKIGSRQKREDPHA